MNLFTIHPERLTPELQQEMIRELRDIVREAREEMAITAADLDTLEFIANNMEVEGADISAFLDEIVEVVFRMMERAR